MNRTARLAIILISVAIVVVGIGFGRHHYLKIKNAEPVKVYKNTLIETNTSPKDRSVKQDQADKRISAQPDTLPEDTAPQSDDNADVEIEPSVTEEPIEDSLVPNEIENTGELTVHPVFSDLVVENLPPKAAAALKQYDEIQLAKPKINEELEVLFEMKPIDFNAIGEESEKLKKLNQQHKGTLEILAKYSKVASNKLDALIAQHNEADRIMEDLDAGIDIDIEEMKQRIETARESK